MSAIKSYLLRLILCAFLLSLVSALPKSRRVGQVLKLCGGCLLILCALGPLLRVELSALPDLVTGLSRSQRQELARERNEALLARLVAEQTEQWLRARGEALGLAAEYAVQTRPEAGSFVPDSVTVTGQWTPEQRLVLSREMARELEIPAERQRWREE